MSHQTPTFESWVADPRNATLERMVWRLPAYRLAAYALDVGWGDATQRSRSAIMAPIALQLYRALGSIGANIAEGYSRSSGRDRVRLYKYALGSARECVVWYRAAAPVLGLPAVADRQAVLHRLVCMLLIVIPRERGRCVVRAG
jgi:four helix bundle protein